MKPGADGRSTLNVRELNRDNFFANSPTRQLANSPTRQLAKAVLVTLASFSAQAAQVNQADLPQMVAQAKKNGAASVIVHLAPTTIAQLRADLKGVKVDMAQRAGRLFAELGQQVWEGGRWDNSIGQIGLYVTEAGLQTLERSTNAVSFSTGQSWSARTKLGGTDGSHAAIDQLIESNGYVDVVVTLNVDGLEFDTLKDGTVSHRPSVKTRDEGRTKARALLNGLSERQALNKSSALAVIDATDAPTVTVRLNREGVLKLADSDLVRSMKPLGFVDARPLNFSPDVLAMAQREGAAQVIITIRTPMMGGNQSKASVDAQIRSHRRTLEEISVAVGMRGKLEFLPRFGVMTGVLPFAEVQALQVLKDVRLVSVELNRPVAQPSLAASTLTMNMPAAWNANFRAAGQNIVVMDTGVQSNHEFFKGANGASRVFFEACYGTNFQIDGTPWESICPQQGTSGALLGDSPAGLAGSAAPRLNCAFFSPDLCNHGTHVAGIAAGRASSLLTPSGLQGVAPDARIAAFQVFSFDQGRLISPTAFIIDLLTAMEALANIMTPGTAANPFVINMSLGGSTLYPGTCPLASFGITDSIETLFTLGVPVVSGTGNNGSTTGISWPACNPRVIKVSAVDNDGVGNTRSPFANLANPIAFPNDFFWLAPGGAGIRSAINGSTTALASYSGTSQATPHVAGLYAVLKAIVPGIAVQDISIWIQANASVPVPVDLCATGTPCFTVFRRPRVP